MTYLDSDAAAPPDQRLRLAAVVPGDVIPAWVQRVLGDCLTSGGLQLVHIFTASAVESRRPLSPPPARRRIHERLDARVFRPGPDAFAPTSLPTTVGVSREDVIANSGRTELGPTVIGRLRAEGIEVVVGLGVPPLEAASSTDVSLWTLEIGGRSSASWFQDLPPELTAGESVVVITLRETGPTPRLRGQMRQTVTSVVPWSTTLTRNKVAWSAASLIVNALRHAQLRVSCRESADRALDSGNVSQAGASSTSAFAFRFRQLVKLTNHALVRSVARDEWHVAYRARDKRHGFDEGTGYRALRAPSGHSYADPILFEHEDRHWLFLEDFVYAKGRARLVCLDLDEYRDGAKAIPVLDEPHHLSYPFVFRRGPDIFMVPESGETKSVELYRAVSFPDRWESLGTLLSGIWGSDATLIEQGGLLWMFLTIARPGMSPSDELYLYYAPDLLGPWEPHRMNPIVSDVRAGRAAGRLFWQDGVLIRPAQDSARRYGHAINFQGVTLLSIDDYQESTIGRLDAYQVGGDATHTYSFDSRYEVIDLLKRRSRWHR